MEAGQRGDTGLGAHPAAQCHRIPATLEQYHGEPVTVGDPLGENQAAPTAPQSFSDIVSDLPRPGLVSNQIPVDRGDAARCREIGAAGVAEARQSLIPSVRRRRADRQPGLLRGGPNACL
jgi:hypothetical protein